MARELVKQHQSQAKDAFLLYFVLRMHSCVAASACDLVNAPINVPAQTAVSQETEA